MLKTEVEVPKPDISALQPKSQLRVLVDVEILHHRTVDHHRQCGPFQLDGGNVPVALARRQSFQRRREAGDRSGNVRRDVVVEIVGKKHRDAGLHRAAFAGRSQNHCRLGPLASLYSNVRRKLSYSAAVQIQFGWLPAPDVEISLPANEKVARGPS